MATKVKLIADGVITPDQITLTTASTGTNTTAPATTAFVQQEISALVDSSPDALNTLNELAAALGDDANFSTTVTNSIALKAPLASPTFTGTVEIPNLTVSGAQGTDGQVLTSTGSGVAWEDASGGGGYSGGNFEITNADQENGVVLTLNNTFDGSGWANNDIGGAINFESSDAGVTQPIRAQIKTVTNNALSDPYPLYTDMVFSTTIGNNAPSEAMRINYFGKVGIGTNNPTQLLDVNGTVELNNLTVAGSQGTDGQVLTSTGSGIAWEDASGGGGSSTLLGLTDVGADGTSGQVLTTNGSGAFTFTTVSGGGGSSIIFKTFGTDSIMVGDDATGTIDAANYNTGLGVDVFASLTTGDNNTAIGYKAGTSLASSDSHNTFIGANAGENSTGYGCTAIGSEALKGWGGSNYNMAIGYRALANNTGESVLRDAIAIGPFAMENLKDYSSFGGDSVAIGSYSHQGTVTSGSIDTTAYRNTAVGFQTMKDITTGNSNVALGYNSGKGNKTNSGTIAIGPMALYSCTSNSTGAIAIGDNALRQATINNGGNVAIGSYSQYSATSGSNNVSMGASSLGSITVAYTNVAIGTNAGYNMTSGRNTVAIGGYSGQVLTTGFNNIYVGMDTHASANNVDNEIVIGSKRNGYNTVDIVGKGSSTGFINPGDGAVYQGNNSASWATTSDRRIKKNIEDNNTGLEAIKQIQVRNFEYRTQDEITDFENPASAAVRKEGIQLGVIAQEIETILPDVVKEESTGVKSVNPDNITWYLVNAVKELSAQVEELKKKVGE